MVLAFVAAVFGFGGIAGVATDIAQVLFWIITIVFIFGLIFGRGRSF